MIILTGVAGAGKSVQGRLLADEAGYPWLSTGELLRVLITGRRRQEMLQGKLLSDDEVISVVNTVLGLIDVSKEFVLDGFPRTIPQAEWVMEQSKKGRFEFTAIFHLIASDDVVKGRLSKRGRADDSDSALKVRFEEYNKVTLPIIEHFKNQGVPIYDIDAARDPMEVHKTIMQHLHKTELDKK